MLQGRYPLGFKLSLHHKDLGIALESASNVKLDMPITALVQQLEADLIQRDLAMTMSQLYIGGTKQLRRPKGCLQRAPAWLRSPHRQGAPASEPRFASPAPVAPARF